MEFQYTNKYTSPLAKKLEVMRKADIDRVLKNGDFLIDGRLAREINNFTLAESVKHFCQLGINRRWHDFINEVKRNVRLDDEGKHSEMTMPELITDNDAWTDEDKLVYEHLMKAKRQSLGG